MQSFLMNKNAQQGCNKVKQYASLGKKVYDQNNIKSSKERFQTKPLGLLL